MDLRAERFAALFAAGKSIRQMGAEEALSQAQGEVEIAQIAHVLEAGPSDAPVDGVAHAPGELVVHQQLDELQRKAAGPCR